MMFGYCDKTKEKCEYQTNMADEIKHLQSMYNAQCKCTDEWAEKYAAEVERKADATLLERIADLENALSIVNARLAIARVGASLKGGE